MVCGHLLPQAWLWTVLMVKMVCQGQRELLVLLEPREQQEPQVPPDL
jgi:hypothetical protein